MDPLRWTRKLLCFILAAIAVWKSPAASGQDLDRALAIANETWRLAKQVELWPGFDLMSIPLAVYTGNRTYLFRHPSPPEGFLPIESARPGVLAFEGRHPAVTANSSADIGDVQTATLVVDSKAATGETVDLAATAVHEAFHVYQRRHHPGWAGNEADLFVYPVDDPWLLQQRRLESAALLRALEAGEAAEAACWSRLALGFRSARFARMDSASSSYERLTELNEGLATYVQHRAAGRRQVEIPSEGFQPTEIRLRAYEIGAAFAALLDTLNPDWKLRLESDDDQALDFLLLAALDSPDREPTEFCSLAAGEREEIERRAFDDVGRMRSERLSRRREFDEMPGWRVIIRTGDDGPLWPLGFDPLNVAQIEGGILHTRFLRLGNDICRIEVVDEPGSNVDVLTEAKGPHPLFNGVHTITIAGLTEPVLHVDGRRVELAAPSLVASFDRAEVVVSDKRIDVLLDSPE